jgi:hypothetical protein
MTTSIGLRKDGRRLGSLLGMSLTLLYGCAAGVEPVPAEEPETQQPAVEGVLSMTDLMLSLVDHNSHLLWDAADPSMAPQDEADWHTLEHAAMIVAASGPLTMIGGSGPEDDQWVSEESWQVYTQNMTDAALEALEAVQRQDLDALVAAGDPLLVSCLDCHNQYKPEIIDEEQLLSHPHQDFSVQE